MAVMFLAGHGHHFTAPRVFRHGYRSAISHDRPCAHGPLVVAHVKIFIDRVDAEGEVNVAVIAVLC